MEPQHPATRQRNSSADFAGRRGLRGGDRRRIQPMRRMSSLTGRSAKEITVPPPEPYNWGAPVC